MPVPDEVIFGPDTQMKTITYGDVRSMAEADKLKVLKLRLDRFFIEQVDELGKNKEGNVKVYAPFPLALLTCVGIETLGEVMYHSDLCDKSKSQREGFLKIAKSLAPSFSRALPQDNKDFDKVTTIAHILYYYQRNTLVHGYQSRGVFLTEELPDWKLESGMLLLNPYWLWGRYKTRYEKLFQELFSNVESTNPRRKSALSYLSRILE